MVVVVAEGVAEDVVASVVDLHSTTRSSQSFPIMPMRPALIIQNMGKKLMTNSLSSITTHVVRVVNTTSGEEEGACEAISMADQVDLHLTNRSSQSFSITPMRPI